MACIRIRAILILLLTLLWCSRRNSAQSVPPPEVREHLTKILPESPTSSLARLERLLVEQGRFGDGVRKKWMDGMKQEGVKVVSVDVDMIWFFFGPRLLKPVRVRYFSDYDGQQIVDEQALERFRRSGLEHALKREAKIRAPHGRFFELPFFLWFGPFRAGTTVELFDEEWLPIPPPVFAFGSTRP